ncbi:hypothetical protein PT974_07287 [Cladobotryum mycophilum]|uniref:Uncharacterized protein n=1 Tax=Cladobotryum mycophilum TaxID=491253 RepID=A0ABR0SNW7_9HYPO
MPFPRASSGMLRTLIRPARTAAPLRSTQIRTQTIGGKESLGGPGGQQPPPRNPGGPEALQRNWMYIGGAFLTLAIGYSWITRHPDEARQARDKSLSEMSGRTKTEMAGFRHD